MKKRSPAHFVTSQVWCALTVASDALLEVLDLRKSRVLAAGTQQVAEALESNAAIAPLVEQGESLLVVC